VSSGYLSGASILILASNGEHSGYQLTYFKSRTIIFSSTFHI
jgi:hypothetical protein